MRNFVVLVVVLLWCQNIHSKEAPSFRNNNFLQAIALRDNRNDLRSLADVWNNIKNVAVIAWDSIKSIAYDTKKKILQWIENLKEEANKIAQSFKDRLEKLKQGLVNLIQNAITMGENIKKCVQEEQKALNAILKEILLNVTSCMASNLKSLEHLDTSMIELNDTSFVDEINKKLNVCLNDKYDTEQCLNDVRQSILGEIEEVERDILETRLETRGKTDEILDTIIGCTTEGFLKASDAIADETILIIQCVSNAKDSV